MENKFEKSNYKIAQKQKVRVNIIYNTMKVLMGLIIITTLLFAVIYKEKNIYIINRLLQVIITIISVFNLYILKRYIKENEVYRIVLGDMSLFVGVVLFGLYIINLEGNSFIDILNNILIAIIAITFFTIGTKNISKSIDSINSCLLKFKVFTLLISYFLFCICYKVFIENQLILFKVSLSKEILLIGLNFFFVYSVLSMFLSINMFNINNLRDEKTDFIFYYNEDIFILKSFKRMYKKVLSEMDKKYLIAHLFLSLIFIAFTVIKLNISIAEVGVSVAVSIVIMFLYQRVIWKIFKAYYTKYNKSKKNSVLINSCNYTKIFNEFDNNFYRMKSNASNLIDTIVRMNKLNNMNTNEYEKQISDIKKSLDDIRY